MKRFFLFIAVLFLSSRLVAQELNHDSLWGVWVNEQQTDTNRYNAMIDIIEYECGKYQHDSALIHAQQLQTFSESKQLAGGIGRSLYWQGRAMEQKGNWDEAMNLYQSGLKIHTKNNDTLGISQCLNTIGIVYARKGNNDSALHYFLEDLELMQGLGEMMNVSSTLANVGIIYRRKGQFCKAMECYLRSLTINEQLDYKGGVANRMMSIAQLYSEQKDYEKALEEYGKSLEMYRSLEERHGEAMALNNMGANYQEMGNLDMALANFLQSKPIWEELSEKQGVAMVGLNIGKILTDKRKYDEALGYYQESLKGYRELGDEKGEAKALNHLGWLNYKVENTSQALEFALAAHKLSMEQGNVEPIQKTAELLYQIYKSTGQEAKALTMHELYIQMRDSVLNMKNQRDVMRQEYQYEYEKEAMADSLEFAKTEAVLTEKTEKQQLGLMAAGGGLILVLVLAFAIYTGKKRSDKLLLNILPAEVAEELKEKGHADAKLFDEVTVLFTDFKGFTQMAEKLTAKELVAEIDECFQAFDEITDKYGIEKIKTIGDAYMAAGGLPTENSASSENVIKAALEIRDYMDAQQIVKGENGFEIRIGIHTGPVVAGIVGIKKFAYDIWGDTVNTAARMESSGEAGKVNISETTYNLVQNKFSFKYRGEIQAKGKGKVKMYFVEDQA